jgi:hypothetical protein
MKAPAAPSGPGSPVLSGLTALPQAVSDVQAALKLLGESPTTAPLAQAVNALEQLLGPLVAKIGVPTPPAPTVLPTPGGK